jgi:DNA-binding GntR family transcriptional regulator
MQHDSYPANPLYKAADAYSRIKAALYSYHSPAGEFLNIRTLASRLKVSPTPVREALIKLALEDVVGFTLRRGYFVKPLDVDDLTADYEMAMLIMKYSIESGGPVLIGRDPTGLTGWSKSDHPLVEAEAEVVAFHLEGLYDRIVRLSANRRFIIGIRQFNARTNRIRRFGLTSASPFYTAVSILHRLEEAIHSGERIAALNLLNEQYIKTINALPDIVRDMNLRAQTSTVSLEELL